MDGNVSDRAIEILAAAAAALEGIDRPKHYALWREDTAPRLGEDLGLLPPFSVFRRLWIHTGDGSGCTASPRLGEWAVDRLREKMEASAIIEAFATEAARNVGRYSEISIIYGVSLDAPCDLGGGVSLLPAPTEAIAALRHRTMFQRAFHLPGTTILQQAFTVTPAYVMPIGDAPPQTGPSATTPASGYREPTRRRVRLACLLASAGGVEIPETQLLPDEDSVFVAGAGNGMGRMFGERPLYNSPVKAAGVQRAFDLLGKFRGLESLTRAIERLGRSRVATSSVDRALELGMAAEIALMHDNSAANTEIGHKISSRAAWLLGSDPADRETIFANMKKLYEARSKAVHSGSLPAKSSIKLDDANELVRRILVALLERGEFPNWKNLTLGGEG